MTFSVTLVQDPASPTGFLSGYGVAHINTTSDWPNNNCTVSDSGTQAIYVHGYPEGDNLAVFGVGVEPRIVLQMCVLNPSGFDYIHQASACYVFIPRITLAARDGATGMRQGPDDGANPAPSSLDPNDTALSAGVCETSLKFIGGPAMTHSWTMVLSYPPA